MYRNWACKDHVAIAEVENAENRIYVAYNRGPRATENVYNFFTICLNVAWRLQRKRSLYADLYVV